MKGLVIFDLMPLLLSVFVSPIATPDLLGLLGACAVSKKARGVRMPLYSVRPRAREMTGIPPVKGHGTHLYPPNWFVGPDRVR